MKIVAAFRDMSALPPNTAPPRIKAVFSLNWEFVTVVLMDVCIPPPSAELFPEIVQ